MKLLLPHAIILALALPALAFDEAHPEKDPARGDALEKAIREKDAAALKTLLRPCDRKKGATFRTSKSGEHTSFPVSNLLIESLNSGDEASQVVLLDYGIAIAPDVLLSVRNLDLFAKHYPDFKTTLGRTGLAFASAAGRNELLQGLLQSGVPPQDSDLAAAVRHSHAGAVRLLLGAGLSPDTKVEIDGRKTNVVALARQRMAFAVLEALGAWPRYEAELAPHRKDRPGANASRYFGIWVFDNGGPIYSFEADGTGTEGFDRELDNPILWRVAQRKDGAVVEVSPVPGHEKEWAPRPTPIVLAAAGEGLVLTSKLGRHNGRRSQVNSDQREGIRLAANAKPYHGPTGEWELSVELSNVPVGDKEEARKQLQQARLVIGSDGKGRFFGPFEAALVAEAGDNPDEIRIMGEGSPPVVAKGSDDWKKLSITEPGSSFTMVWVRKAK